MSLTIDVHTLKHKMCTLVSTAMKLYQYLLASAFSIIGLFAVAQPVSETFYDSRVINGQSVEMTTKGTMKFLISHRFGPVSGGAYELWGLDQSTIRLGFDYGVTDWLTLGIGRSSFEKTFDGFYKIRILRQGNAPVSLVWFNSLAIRGQEWPNDGLDHPFDHRMAYTAQFLAARKLGDKLSLQLMPSWVHRNYVATPEESNDVFSLGAAGRFKLTKNITTSIEYYYVPNGMQPDGFYDSFTFAIDFNTKGHVFQINIGNATGMTEKFFITENRGSWANGDVGLGFNISRDFKIGGKKY